MIKIDRPATVPPILTKQGAQRMSTHCKNYDADSTSYQECKKTFSFAFSIYADATVKDALMKMQHEKCCYCERIIGKAGDIEHFRPKGEVCQTNGDASLTPGYYWLAYDWNNLLYACKDCNQTHKGMQFLSRIQPSVFVHTMINALSRMRMPCLSTLQR